MVVNYNARRYLADCVRSLKAEGIGEIVVVDNASTDGSVEDLRRTDPDVVVVQTGRNLGYGGAVNRGVARAATDLVLVMNPDAVVEPGAVEALVNALERDVAVGIVGPRIENPDGSLYPSARTFPAMGDAIGHAFLGLLAPRNRWSRRYQLLDWDHAVPAPVDWVSGSCFLVRRACFEQVGGFDESYFMFLEDVDLCWRAHRAGWQVHYEPAGRVVHVKSHSVDQRPYRMILAHHRSLLRFAAGTATGWRRALLPVVAAGLVARAVLASAQKFSDARRPAARPGAPLRGE